MAYRNFPIDISNEPQNDIGYEVRPKDDHDV